VRKKLIDTDSEDFEAQFGAGVRGGFAFFQTLGRIMRSHQSGGLVGITSEAVDQDYPGAMGAYVPAKYAMRGMLRTLKAELEPFGVRVHEVAPPFLPVGMNRDLPSRPFELMEEKKGPLPTPAQVAESVSALLGRC
jgi:NAD(P)-dependent dehydrogenase (short-subunit alcohol dehydrogenase family)